MLLGKGEYGSPPFQGGDVQKRCEARFRTGVITGCGWSKGSFARMYRLQVADYPKSVTTPIVLSASHLTQCPLLERQGTYLSFKNVDYELD